MSTEQLELLEYFMADAQYARVEEVLSKAQNILVVTHISPDGDALGSLTAMGLALKQLKKSVTLVCDDAVQPKFAYLPLSDSVERKPVWNREYDLLIAVDCGDEQRMGKAYTLLRHKPPILNIDHHVSNTMFGEVNIIESDASSTTEILTNMLPQIGVTITTEIATSLLTGLVTDTLAFRVVGVTAKTLRTAADLVDAGANLAEITMNSLVIKEEATVKLWRIGLNKMKMIDGIAWTVLNNKDHMYVSKKEKVSSHGLGNMMADIDVVKMSAVISEREDGRIRVGFRSRPPYDVSIIASELGGGGHRLAAGCALDIPLDEAIEQVLEVARRSIAEQEAALNLDK